MQVAQGGLAYTFVDSVELRKRLANGEAFSIIDARSAERRARSGQTIAGAVRVAPDELPRRIREVVRGRTILLLGDPDAEESMALAMVASGFADVWLIEGGFEAFQQAGGGVVPV